MGEHTRPKRRLTATITSSRLAYWGQIHRVFGYQALDALFLTIDTIHGLRLLTGIVTTLKAHIH